MAIETPCSGCGQKLAVAEEHAGKQARCPSCGEIYTVPHAQLPDAPAGMAAATGAGGTGAGLADAVDPALAETTPVTGSSAGPASEQTTELRI